ncbi:MAG: hypothetical protein DWG83_01105 [Chloroflexi bacterium]|nr:hypothetical protein [Chloroflexota bacterium]MDA1240515.1 hypothetical protein [Chloroflexota bacterium]MQC19154.1 hypothetical protein [Chloroflexota bacterium]
MIPDPEVLGPLVAGWIAGAAAGLFLMPVLVIWAARPGRMVHLHGRSRLPVLVILFLNGLMITLTLIGLVLGGLYTRTGGLTFSLVVLAVTGVAGGLYLFVRGTWRAPEAPLVLACLLITALAFAGLLPWLAERT